MSWQGWRTGAHGDCVHFWGLFLGGTRLHCVQIAGGAGSAAGVKPKSAAGLWRGAGGVQRVVAMSCLASWWPRAVCARVCLQWFRREGLSFVEV